MSLRQFIEQERKVRTRLKNEYGEALEINRKQLIENFLKDHRYQIGDIATDHIGKIVINDITVVQGIFGWNVHYTGIMLKKDGTKRKDNRQRTIYSVNNS